jgi:type VI protein secretion system component Hcp
MRVTGTGQTFGQIQIELTKNGQRFYQILLNNARVTGISTTDNNATLVVPVEQITFGMASVTISYWRQKADGQFDLPVTETFSC